MGRASVNENLAKRLRELFFHIPFYIGNPEKPLLCLIPPHRSMTKYSFKNGDKTAFEAIYRFYAGALLNYGYKIASDRALVEDSIQDLFYELWNNRSRIAEPNSIKYYLFKALRYKINRNARTNDRAHPLDIALFEELLTKR